MMGKTTTGTNSDLVHLRSHDTKKILSVLREKNIRLRRQLQQSKLAKDSLLRSRRYVRCEKQKMGSTSRQSLKRVVSFQERVIATLFEYNEYLQMKAIAKGSCSCARKDGRQDEKEGRNGSSSPAKEPFDKDVKLVLSALQSFEIANEQ